MLKNYLANKPCGVLVIPESNLFRKRGRASLCFVNKLVQNAFSNTREMANTASVSLF